MLEMRTLYPGDEIQIRTGPATWVNARCVSVGYSDIIAELVTGGSIMVARTEPKQWRFHVFSQATS